MASEELVARELVRTIEGVFLGAIISSMIYGLTCLQTFSYFRSRHATTDTKWLRLMVLVLFVLDSAHQALVIHMVYNYVMLGLTTPIKVFTTLLWSGPVEIILNAILKTMFDVFLTLRLWQLNSGNYIVAISALLCLADFGADLSFGIRCFGHFSFSQTEQDLKIHGVIELAITTAANIFISSCLCYRLYKMRTGLEKTNDLVSRLIALTISTGAFCALCNLVDLILSTQDVLYGIVMSFFLSKRKLYFLYLCGRYKLSMRNTVYANALLTTLNTRRYFQRLANGSTTVSNSINLSQPGHRIEFRQPSDVLTDSSTVSNKDRSRGTVPAGEGLKDAILMMCNK
ncbi:hypothetical protein C8Q76DRAFT_791363 [Earliella scabrosa]|nr:hypothetical protein C8Q76DRAFT_791363 [Earliella scabrosa]